MYLGPYFEKMVTFIQNKLKIKRRTAIGILVFLVNVLGTTSYLVFGLIFATRYAGVPLLP